MVFLKNLSNAILLMSTSALMVVAQHARVEMAKHSTAIPKVCESVVPANIEGPVDVPALVSEAYCKGAGDMLVEYTYVTHSIRREKDKKGKEKQETFTYEVFFPTLKSGMRTKGILVVTSHNGVPVPPNELEKERARAAERTEKEEEKIALETPAPSSVRPNSSAGMLPLGMYTRTASNRESFGRKYSAKLAVHTFLKTCELTLARREQIDGRETLIFTFTPRPDAQFADNEKYIAQLTGEIWIDAKDRIVIRLAGWPANAPATLKASKVATNSASVKASDERPPAVYVEMMRLPQQGIWLPRVTRINGADYPTLFGGITTDSTSTYSEYIRFSTDIKDVKVGEPDKP
jgi:hypothetical protein